MLANIVLSHFCRAVANFEKTLSMDENLTMITSMTKTNICFDVIDKISGSELVVPAPVQVV